MKVTIEEVNGSWETRHGKTYSHSVSCKDMSRTKYIKMIKKNYKHYIVTNDIMIAPSGEDRVEEVNKDFKPAIHPVLEPNHFDKITSEDIKAIANEKGVSVEAIVDVINAETGDEFSIDDFIIFNEGPELNHNKEQFELSQNINTKTSNMNNENSSNSKEQSSNNQKQPKMETKKKTKKKSVGKKVVKLGALSLAYTTGAVSTPIHFTAQTLADTFQAIANKTAQAEVFIVDKLGCLPDEIELTDGSKIPMTRELGAMSVAMRTKKIQSYATLPISLLKSLGSNNDKEQVQAEPA